MRWAGWWCQAQLEDGAAPAQPHGEQPHQIGVIVRALGGLVVPSTAQRGGLSASPTHAAATRTQAPAVSCPRLRSYRRPAWQSNLCLALACAPAGPRLLLHLQHLQQGDPGRRGLALRHLRRWEAAQLAVGGGRVGQAVWLRAGQGGLARLQLRRRASHPCHPIGL